MSPLPKGTRYRYRKGTKIRLAFAKGTNRVIEAKNMETGKTHTPGEFKKQRRRKRYIR